jgi:phage terminase large subunit GpA-like protein
MARRTQNALGAKISAAAGNVLTGKKGKSGVTLCYHEPKLFHKLQKDQKAELSEWTKNNRENKRKNGGGTKGQEKGRRVKAQTEETVAAMNASHTAELAVMKAQLELMGVYHAPPAEAVIKPSVGATIGFVPAPALLPARIGRDSLHCLGNLTVYPKEEGW